MSKIKGIVVAVLLVIGALSTAVGYTLDSDPNTNPDWAAVSSALQTAGPVLGVSVLTYLGTVLSGKKKDDSNPPQN